LPAVDTIGPVGPEVKLETDRLRLRPLAMTDVAPMSRLQSDPEMMRYMGDGHVHDHAETEVWLRWHIDLWDVDGFSLFAVDLKATMELVGWIGLARPYWFPEMMPTPELGWFIDRDQWGQGLATEGARAVLGFAFDDIGANRVIAICNAENVASGRVMEKIGMSLWQEGVPHPEHSFPLRMYEVMR
jgi:RimJ/RimL family protein N-acetyltransferase